MDWVISMCRSCRANVIWAVSEAGRPQPFDADPDPRGNRKLENRGVIHRGKRVPTAVPVDPDQGELFGDTSELYMPHHATCPQGREWRKA